MSKIADREPAQGPSTGVLAVLLAAVIFVVIAGLNVLEDEGVGVSADRLEALVGQQLVDRISIRGSELHATLNRQIRLAESRTPVRGVLVQLEAPPGAYQIEAWRGAGIEVRSGPEAGGHDWAWAGLMAVLLTLGLWHLVSQGRRHRRGGAPRQRLLDAERDLLAGKLTRPEYDELVATISMEL
ncbi:hypothetical protein ACFL6X_07910 [Candidatus Latescibacterota bacterium]